MSKLDEENKELNKKRRIPLQKKFMCKKINDILYGYLQSVATFNPNTNTLYVKKDDVNFAELEEVFDGKFKRRTLVNHMSNLISYGFVKEDTMMDTYGNEIKVYVLPYNKESLYKLIPLDTLKFLVDTVTTSVVVTYVYLLNKWEWKRGNYIFTSEELIKNCLGIKSAHTRDYERINNVLTCLVNNGLIDYEDIYIKKNGVAIPKKKLVMVSKTYIDRRKKK